MELKVENVCGLLIRSKLMTPDEMKAMYARWQAESKDVTSLAQFTRWLVSREYLTEYQASLLAKGHAEDFFLGQYKILDRLGRGRMAAVYRAVHHLGQVVAIKVLPPSKVKDPQTLARFQREARLAVRLKHPNVVRSFQLAEGNGVYYLVMEYLDGETLEEVLQRRKKLPPNEAVRLIYQALQGLQHIHEQGLIHRDLKPANLMLVPARRPGEPDTTLQATVKILDIGLGRAVLEGPDGATNLNLTGEGVLLGTPDYLAPEQARNAHDIDIRADIYSLGCVLYQVLTGQPPFPDRNVVNQILRHATETPRPIRDFNPAAPDGLQQIVNWMMAKEPGQRYPTPERAGQALQVFLTAGTEAASKAVEETPQLRRYLTWLETGDNAGAAAPAPPAALASRRAPETPAPPAPRPEAPAPRQGPPSKKQRHDRRAKQGPRAAPAAPAPARLEDIDVELVTAPPPGPAAGAAPPQGGLGLSPRDWTLLGIGAGCVIAAGVVGMLLALALK